LQHPRRYRDEGELGTDLPARLVVSVLVSHRIQQKKEASMSGLRDEIIESQKARSELLKWKLLIVSALGAAGLGFTEHGGARGAYLVLLLIPLVCSYVDFQSRHHTLRILVIGKFIRLNLCGVETAYEHFIVKTTSMGPKKLSVFNLEGWALDYSTYFLSFLVMIAGFFSLLWESLSLLGCAGLEGLLSLLSSLGIVGLIPLETKGTSRVVIEFMFLIVGLLGIILSYGGRRWFYEPRAKALRELAKDQEMVKELRSISREAVV
jgi:hypothetical protein